MQGWVFSNLQHSGVCFNEFLYIYLSGTDKHSQQEHVSIHQQKDPLYSSNDNFTASYSLT